VIVKVEFAVYERPTAGQHADCEIIEHGRTRCILLMGVENNICRKLIVQLVPDFQCQCSVGFYTR
jgi:hypothetical protein